MKSKLKYLVRYAVLAPSGHNSQPWQFKIEDSAIIVRPDTKRRREEVDPNDRELYIALGCAVKNIEVAANYFGMIFSKDYEIGEKTAIVFHFKNGITNTQDKELFEAITRRQTNRGEYEEKAINKDCLTMLANLGIDDGVFIDMFGKPAEKTKLADLIYTSDRVWFKTKELVEEMDRWISQDVNNRTLDLFKLAGDLKEFIKRDQGGVVAKATRDKQLALKAPVLAVISAEKEGVAAWIKTGENFEKFILKTTSYGLAHAYFNTVIELNTQRRKLNQLFKFRGTPQLMVRLGYPREKLGHAPRRPIDDVIVT